jgi:hypothetical protein
MLKVLTLLFLFLSAVSADVPANAPRLPATKGKVVKVSNINSLNKAISGLKSNTIIVISKGTYKLSKPLNLPKGLSNIVIRGATGKFEDVVIEGAGMNNKAVWHGIMINNTQKILIADLTISKVGFHPITAAAGSESIHVYHCRLLDAGEQFIKVNSGKNEGSDNGKVEYCVIEYSKEGPPNGYTNGVDVHGGSNWIIRHNLFKNIRTPAGAKYKNVPAVLMWNGAKNTICEGNTFINCDRAIAFGLTKRSFNDHEGGIIRNNIIYSGKGQVKNQDAGIYVSSPNTKVLHNTILLNGNYPNAIEIRFSFSSNVEVSNNLTDAQIRVRDGATTKESGNFIKAKKNFFVKPEMGDLHLKSTTLKKVKLHKQCTLDFTGKKRSSKSVAGAHQK